MASRIPRTGPETVRTEPDHLSSVDQPAAYLTGYTPNRAETGWWSRLQLAYLSVTDDEVREAMRTVEH